MDVARWPSSRGLTDGPWYDWAPVRDWSLHKCALVDGAGWGAFVR